MFFCVDISIGALGPASEAQCLVDLCPADLRPVDTHYLPDAGADAVCVLTHSSHVSEFRFNPVRELLKRHGDYDDLSVCWTAQ